MKTQLYKNEWLLLPEESRKRLMQTFRIKKSEPVQTIGGIMGAKRFVSDGVSNLDLATLSAGAMIGYLGEGWETSDFSHLLDLTLKKLYGQPLPGSEEPPEIASAPQANLQGSVKTGTSRTFKKKTVLQRAA